MELEAIRKYVQDHPDGVLIRMIDGTKYKIPQRDYIFFGPPRETAAARRGVHGTSFFVFESDGMESMKLVNALLVANVEPLSKNGNGKHGGRGRKAS